MNRCLKSVLGIVLAGAGLLTLAPASLALPVLNGNQHPATPVGWERVPGDDTRAHQHWNQRAFNVLTSSAHPTGGVGSECTDNSGANTDCWIANKVWDNNGTTTFLRIGAPLQGGTEDFGHGFIANRVLYWFDPAFAPPAADLDNNAANDFIERVVDGFADWEALVTAEFASHERDDLRLGFHFQRWNGATAPQGEQFIAVRFEDLTGVTGVFDSTARTLTFDSTLVFNGVPVDWYTGAASPGAAQAGQQDFLTTAEHEIGHAVGLGHSFAGNKDPGESIMGDASAPRGSRVAIDEGSIEGLLALYTQPVPEPGSAWMLLAGLALLGRRRHAVARAGTR